MYRLVGSYTFLDVVSYLAYDAGLAFGPYVIRWVMAPTSFETRSFGFFLAFYKIYFANNNNNNNASWVSAADQGSGLYACWVSVLRGSSSQSTVICYP